MSGRVVHFNAHIHDAEIRLPLRSLILGPNYLLRLLAHEARYECIELREGALPFLLSGCQGQAGQGVEIVPSFRIDIGGYGDRSQVSRRHLARRSK